MSWTDKCAVRTINQLRDRFSITDFVETGAFKGINARFQSRNFFKVLTCESNKDYCFEGMANTSDCRNVQVHLDDSEHFLREYTYKHRFDGRKDIPFFYLDAHFYRKEGPRWQVQKELKALDGFENCVIAIHDFANGMGHCIYDGERLGMKVVGKLLKEVNP
mgnify:FL=1